MRAVPARGPVAILCLACRQQSPELTLAQRLRDLRVVAGLSQRRLARHAKIGLSTLEQAESGKCRPPGTVERLPRALRTTAAVLRGEERLPLATERNGKPEGRR
jgi:transcriptional regulator with XRE-family HTH domain